MAELPSANAHITTRRKELNDDETLTLEMHVSHHDLPGKRVFTMHHHHVAGSTILLRAPEAYLLSEAVYSTLFDSIQSEDDFRKAKDRLEDCRETLNEIYGAVSQYR